jgi:hypothetical protein
MVFTLTPNGLQSGLAPRGRNLSNIAGWLDNYKLYLILIKHAQRNTRPWSPRSGVAGGPRYLTMRRAERLAAIWSKIVSSEAVSGAK